MDIPTASAQVPTNKNNASTSLVQARLGQALFSLLVLWTRSVGERFAHSFVGVGVLKKDLHKRGSTLFHLKIYTTEPFCIYEKIVDTKPSLVREGGAAKP